MISNKIGILDPAHGHFSGSHFSNMTREAIEDAGREILARQAKGKMNADDIAAAKAVKAVLGIYDGSTKQPDDAAKKEGAKPEEGKKEGAKKEEGKKLPDELNPEAKPVNAQVASGG